MSLKINGQVIPENIIVQEMNKMRDKYIESFPDQNRMQREKQLFEWAKENILERHLLRQYAIDNIDVKQEELEAKYGNFSENVDSEKLAQVREKIKIEKLLQAIYRNSEEVIAKEVRSYYRDHIEDYKIPEKVHVKQISMGHPDNSRQENKAALAKIKKAKRELDKGEKFVVVAKKYLQCLGRGFDLGYISRDKMGPDFEKVVFSLKKGEISDIIETPYGYHIAKLYERQAEGLVPFEQVKNEINEKLEAEKKTQALEKFVDNLKKDANIEYIEPINKAISATKGFKFDKPLDFILVKPTGSDCNMTCEYCFYLDKQNYFGNKQHRMNEVILGKMIEQAAYQSEGHLNFGWQGGEPTLMGLDFFKRAIELQDKFDNVKFGNSIQTNGLLLNQDWARFLSQNNFLVGLSIDGKKHVHDKYRKDKDGKGTWGKVKNNAEMLLANDVEVNSLSAVTDYSVNYPQETYDFLKDIGFKYMQFIPIVEQGREGKKATSFSVSGEKYGKFLCRIFDLWKDDFTHGQPTTSIRFFDAVFHKYVGKEPPECFLKKECGGYIVVEHDGDVYPCDFFVGPDWKLGNIAEKNMLEMLNSDKQKRFGELKLELADQCKNCKWMKICRGGCTKDRIKDPRDENLSHFCQAYKIFFEYADEDLKNLAKRYQEKQSRGGLC
ncbi:MAG: anaerobic sulfatase maturase [Candidatus Marinimicrobia bacterium]|nr:anaerobic sulfatase maturase [Candidatus Neomarinimicrobiota bacterium]